MLTEMCVKLSKRTHKHTRTDTHLSLFLSLSALSIAVSPPSLFRFLLLSANYWPEGRGFTVRGWRENERRKRERGAGEETRLPELLPETRRGWKLNDCAAQRLGRQGIKAHAAGWGRRVSSRIPPQVRNNPADRQRITSRANFWQLHPCRALFP